MAAQTLAAEAIAFYKRGEHASAVASFTAALEAAGAGEAATLYKNRAAARAALGEWVGAEADLGAAIGASGGALRGRCLLKRSFARATLERHGAAAADAAAAAALVSGGERAACLAQAARCRSAVAQDAAALRAASADAAGLVHQRQTLRLNLATAIPARVAPGTILRVVVRVANEFGLWRVADWGGAAVGEAASLRVDGRGDGVVFSAIGETTLRRDGRVELAVRCSGVGGGIGALRVAVVAAEWRRPPLAVLSLPVALDARAGAGVDREERAYAGATCCREVAVGPGAGAVVVGEAAGLLGIGGKLWDASFALLAYVAGPEKGDFTTRVFRDPMFQRKHLHFENLKRNDHSSKDEPK